MPCAVAPVCFRSCVIELRLRVPAFHYVSSDVQDVHCLAIEERLSIQSTPEEFLHRPREAVPLGQRGFLNAHTVRKGLAVTNRQQIRFRTVNCTNAGSPAKLAKLAPAEGSGHTRVGGSRRMVCASKLYLFLMPLASLRLGSAYEDDCHLPSCSEVV